MQQFILTISTDDLIKANAEFRQQSNNSVNVTVHLTASPSENNRTMECHRRDGNLLMSTSDHLELEVITDALMRNGVRHEVTTYEGQRIRINVLELLRTEWRLTASASQRVLRIEHFDGTFRLDFINDGVNLYAQYDSVHSSDTNERRAATFAVLSELLTRYTTQFEVL